MHLKPFLRTKINSVNELLSNAIWLLSVEFVAKTFRIFTIVVLAGQFLPITYVTVLLALSFYVVFVLLLRAGVGSQIINYQRNQIESFTNNGLFKWFACLTIVIGQWCSADFSFSLYVNENIVVLLKIMALINLIYPLASVKVLLLQRESKMLWFSIKCGASVIIENVYIATLYPYFCKLERKGQLLEQQKKIFILSLFIVFLIVFQILVVPMYVTILFDEKWLSVVPIFISLLFCLFPIYLINAFKPFNLRTLFDRKNSHES